MSNGASVPDTVKRIICEKLECSEDKVTDNAKFIEDLGADSLDITELLMALEEEYSITIEDDANEIQTVGDAVRYIENKV